MECGALAPAALIACVIGIVMQVMWGVPRVLRLDDDGADVLLVVAHPDDESMFFVPLLRCYPAARVVCLSNGNYDGLGAQRAVELKRACDIIGMVDSSTQLLIIDEPELQDGPHAEWPVARIADIVVREAKRCGARRVFTFDAGGVSGHANHVSTYRGVRAALPHLGATVAAFALRTERSLLYKYSGPCGAALRSTDARTRTSAEFSVVWRAMRAHDSQWVWYRRLFVLFSSYSWRNDFDVIARAPGLGALLPQMSQRY